MEKGCGRLAMTWVAYVGWIEAGWEFDTRAQ
jgi:hypothetical protein